MTRDEPRAKCIEAQLSAFFDMQHKLGYAPQRDHPDVRICMTAAFDALRTAGARVNAIEPTEEMIEIGMEKMKHLEGSSTKIMLREIWHPMSAAGDLTNPPEKSHDPRRQPS